VTFVYADATVGPVYLLGSFNGWDPTGHPLRRVDGVWQVTVYLPAGVYPYLFATGDGGRSVPRHATPDGDGERYARVAVPDDLPGLRAA
jgi:1,4-alpha-glucan branching enzyme